MLDHTSESFADGKQVQCICSGILFDRSIDRSIGRSCVVNMRCGHSGIKERSGYSRATSTSRMLLNIAQYNKSAHTLDTNARPSASKASDDVRSWNNAKFLIMRCKQAVRKEQSTGDGNQHSSKTHYVHHGIDSMRSTHIVRSCTLILLAIARDVHLSINLGGDVARNLENFFFCHKRSKTKQGKARQGKARQGKAMQSKAGHQTSTRSCYWNWCSLQSHAVILTTSSLPPRHLSNRARSVGLAS